MTAVRGEERFFFDESLLGVGKAITAARRDAIHAGHPLIPQVPVGALDTTWMPEVAARNLVVIARDRRIRTKPAERAVLQAHGLRVFWLAGKRDQTSWDYLVRLVTAWPAMEQAITDNGDGPWFMAIGDTGRLRPLPV